MVKIYKLDNNEIPEEIEERIRAGEVFIYPTDTVYGIGCNALNEEAVEKARVIKGSTQDKPLSVAFSDFEQIEKFVDYGNSESVLREKLPGPVTLIVGRGKIPKFVTGGMETVGVRIPDFDLIRDIIRLAKTPIITTSANLGGEMAPREISEIKKDFLEKVDFVIDAGPCGSGTPSKIIDLTKGETVLR